MKSQKPTIKQNVFLKPVFWTSVAITALGLITAITGNTINRTTKFQLDQGVRQHVSTQIDDLFDRYTSGELSMSQYHKKLEDLKEQTLRQMIETDDEYSKLDKVERQSFITSIAGTAGIGLGFAGMIATTEIGLKAEKKEKNSVAAEEEESK